MEDTMPGDFFATPSPELAALEERWNEELNLVEIAVQEEYDPTNAFESSRRTAREIERHAYDHPGERKELARLIARARVDMDRSRTAADRFLLQSEERGVHYHQREHAAFQLPLHALRRPFPPSRGPGTGIG
jgi:hypothetical protein